MPRGISRINNYYNRIEAWTDWTRIAQQAEEAGRKDLAIDYAPDGDAGWRIIDKAIAAVRAELKKQEQHDQISARI